MYNIQSPQAWFMNPAQSSRSEEETRYNYDAPSYKSMVNRSPEDPVQNKENYMIDSQYTLKNEITNSPSRSQKKVSRRTDDEKEGKLSRGEKINFLNFHSIRVSKEDFRAMALQDGADRLFYKLKVYPTRIEKWQIDRNGNEVEGGLLEVTHSEVHRQSERVNIREFVCPPNARFLGSRLIPLPLPRESQERLAQAFQNHFNNETSYEELLNQQRTIYKEYLSSTTVQDYQSNFGGHNHQIECSISGPESHPYSYIDQKFTKESCNKCQPNRKIETFVSRAEFENDSDSNYHYSQDGSHFQSEIKHQTRSPVEIRYLIENSAVPHLGICSQQLQNQEGPFKLCPHELNQERAQKANPSPFEYINQISIDPNHRPLNLFESYIPVSGNYPADQNSTSRPSQSLSEGSNGNPVLSKDFNEWIEKGVFKQILVKVADHSKNYLVTHQGCLPLIAEVPEDRSDTSPDKKRSGLIRADSRGNVIQTQRTTPCKDKSSQAAEYDPCPSQSHSDIHLPVQPATSGNHEENERTNSNTCSQMFKSDQKYIQESNPDALETQKATAENGSQTKSLGTEYVYHQKKLSYKGPHYVECPIREEKEDEEDENPKDKRLKEMTPNDSVEMLRPRKINTVSNGSNQRNSYSDCQTYSNQQIAFPSLMCAENKVDKSIQVQASVQLDSETVQKPKLECNNFLILGATPKPSANLKAFLIESIQIEGRKKSVFTSEGVQTDFISPEIAARLVQDVMNSQDNESNQPFTISVTQERGSNIYMINVETQEKENEDKNGEDEENNTIRNSLRELKDENRSEEKGEREERVSSEKKRDENENEGEKGGDSEEKDFDAEVTIEKSEEDRSSDEDEEIAMREIVPRSLATTDKPKYTEYEGVKESLNNPLTKPIPSNTEYDYTKNSMSGADINSLMNYANGDVGNLIRQTEDDYDFAKSYRSKQGQLRSGNESEIGDSRNGKFSLNQEQQKCGEKKGKIGATTGFHQSLKQESLNTINEECDHRKEKGKVIEEIGENSFESSVAKPQIKSKHPSATSTKSLKGLASGLEEIVGNQNRKENSSFTQSQRSLAGIPIEPLENLQFEETAKFASHPSAIIQGLTIDTTAKKDKTEPQREKSKSQKRKLTNFEQTKAINSSFHSTKQSRDKTPDVKLLNKSSSKKNEQQNQKKSRSPTPLRGQQMHDKEARSVNMIKKQLEESNPRPEYKKESTDSSYRKFSPAPSNTTQKRSLTPKNKVNGKKSPVPNPRDNPVVHKQTIQTLFQDQMGPSRKKTQKGNDRSSVAADEEVAPTIVRKGKTPKADNSLTHFNQVSDSENNSVASHLQRENLFKNRVLVEKNMNHNEFDHITSTEQEALKSHRSTKSHYPNNNPEKRESIFDHPRDSRTRGLKGSGNFGSSSKTVQNMPPKKNVTPKNIKNGTNPKSQTKMQKSGSFSKQSQGKMSNQTFGVPDSRLNSKQASLTRNSESHNKDSVSTESLLRDQILNEFIVSLCTTGILCEEDCDNEDFFIENQAIMIGFEEMTSICKELGFLPATFDFEDPEYSKHNELLSAMWFILGGEEQESICIQDLSVFILARFGLGLNCIVKDGSEEDMFTDAEVKDIESAYRVFYEEKVRREEEYAYGAARASSGFKKTVIEIVEESDQTGPYEAYAEEPIEEEEEEEDRWDGNQRREGRGTVRSRNHDGSFVSRNQPPKSTYSGASSPALLLDVNLGNGKVERVVMHEDDDPEEVADAIIKKNSKLVLFRPRLEAEEEVLEDPRGTARL